MTLTKLECDACGKTAPAECTAGVLVKPRGWHVFVLYSGAEIVACCVEHIERAALTMFPRSA
jgi:hypothetical protein